MQTFSRISVSVILFALLALPLAAAAQAPVQTACPASGGSGAGTCNDGKDNDGDCRADWGGVTMGTTLYPPDPACITKDSAEVADVPTGSEIPLIPCTNKCDLGSVFEFLNNLISFLIKFILFPVAILLFVYAGFKYITAQGNPAKKANVKKMIWNLIRGMLLILCAWVIVKTLLVIIGYDDNLFFFE